MTRPVAIYLQDAHPVDESIEHVRYAEARGFEAVWQADCRLVRDAVVPMAAFAACTERIRIGSGVVDCWTRNPARLAATFSTLDDLAPGRVILGLGAWWDPLAARVGVSRARPLKAMREIVTACRALLNDETVTFDGEFVQLDYVQQERRPKDVPIYIGATGMKMMALTGEIADGVVFNYLVSPQYNQQAMEALAEGAARAGRGVDDLDRPQLVVCSVASSDSESDRRDALDGARMLVTQYLGQQPHIMKASGVPRSLLDEVGSVLTWPATHEQVTAASKLVPDEIVQMLCAAGTADECRDKVLHYIDNGCTTPVLYPLGPDPRVMIDAFADWD